MEKERDYKTEVLISEKAKIERDESDKRYAQKLVERVLWAVLTAIFLYAVGYLATNLLGGHI